MYKTTDPNAYFESKGSLSLNKLPQLPDSGLWWVQVVPFKQMPWMGSSRMHLTAQNVFLPLKITLFAKATVFGPTKYLLMFGSHE